MKYWNRTTDWGTPVSIVEAKETKPNQEYNQSNIYEVTEAEYILFDKYLYSIQDKMPNNPKTGKPWLSGFDPERIAFVKMQTEKERLVKLTKDGIFNTSLTTYFNSVYRRANNLPDNFYTNLTIDGKARDKKQILNSISGLAVDAKYIIAYEGSSDFIALPDNQIETYLKDIFVIEENYRTNKNPEWRRLVATLEIQQAVEEKFTAPDSSVLKLIHQLMYINLQGTEHASQVPDASGIDWGSLVSGGTT